MQLRNYSEQNLCKLFFRFKENTDLPLFFLKVGFEGIVGSGYAGDIAVDDISTLPQACGSSQSML